MSAAMPHPQLFSGESVVSWSDLNVIISVPWYLGLMFRTRKEDSVLMEATSGGPTSFRLQVTGAPCHEASARWVPEGGTQALGFLVHTGALAARPSSGAHPWGSLKRRRGSMSSFFPPGGGDGVSEHGTGPTSGPSRAQMRCVAALVSL